MAFQTLGGETVVVLNPLAVRELLKSPSGAVMRNMFVRGERVRQRAIAEAPVKTGNLRSHIVKRFASLGDDTVVIVGIDGAQVPYAYWVHEGAPRHPITGNPLLVFFWGPPNGPGEVVAFPRVDHPGNKPNRFLIRALTAAAG